jgi:hypothetical protein
MTGKHKKIVLAVNQKLELPEKFENAKSATELAKNYEVGIE